jgi:hypothetical protein
VSAAGELPQSQTPDNVTFFAAVVFLAVVIWAFRFLWLYVPAALGYSVSGFLKRIRPYYFSLSMLATWLLCFLPLAVLFLMGSEIFSSLLNGADASAPSTAFTYASVCLQAVIEILMVMTASVAMAFGVASLYGTKEPPR